MILTYLPYKVRNSGPGGRWKLGFINLTASISQQLEYKPQNVGLLIFPENEELTEEKIRFVVKQHKEIKELESKLDILKNKE